MMPKEISAFSPKGAKRTKWQGEIIGSLEKIFQVDLRKKSGAGIDFPLTFP
jgi:hypothetical protein